MLFYIMNKDVKVLSFICETVHSVNNIYVKDYFNIDLLPLDIKVNGNLFNWLNNRLILSHRKNVIEFFMQLGITKQEDILQITKGVSLNDTYWIKAENDKLKWGNVSPYTNSLNREIAHYAFTDSKRINGKKIGSSPDFATSGDFPKCWKRFDGNIYLIKGGTVGHSTAGNEPYSELYADIISEKLKLNHVHYKYINYKNMNATKCINMCSEKIGIYPLYLVAPKVRDYPDFLDLLKSDEQKKQGLDMLLLDYLLLNPDRHFGNISFFVDNDTQQIGGLAPIYDNNLALLPTYSEKTCGSVDAYIDSFNNFTNGFRTRTDMSFEDLFRLIDCKYIRDKLKLLRNFKFETEYHRDLEVNNILKRQLSLIPN